VLTQVREVSHQQWVALQETFTLRKCLCACNFTTM